MDACAQELQSGLEDTILQADMDNALLEKIKPSGLSISTISIIMVCTNLQNLLADDGGNPATHARVVHHAMQNFDDARVKSALLESLPGVCIGLVDNNFGNSFTISVQEKGDRNTSLKVFTSGKIQCSGLKGFNDCVPLALLAQRVLNIILRRQTQDICITDFKVSLINSVSSINAGIDTMKLYNILYPECTNKVLMSAKVVKRLSWKHSFDKDCVTALVFRSGKIIFTGAKVPSQLAEAYSRVMSTIEKHADVLLVPVAIKIKSATGKRGRKRKEDTFKALLQSFQA